MDGLGSSGDSISSNVLYSGAGDEDGGLQVPKALLSFRISVRGGNKNQEYRSLQYMEVVRPVDTVEETTGCVCLWCRTDDEVYHILRLGADISRQGDLTIGEWFGINRVVTPQEFVSMLKAKHAITQFTERISCLFRRFYLNRFYSNGQQLFTNRFFLSKIKTIIEMKL